jgi:hypothetical protein
VVVVTHSEKVSCFEQLLRKRGYWLSNAIPPASRLLWKLGIEAPPPYFLSFTTGALVSGLSFGLIFGAINSLFIWPANISNTRAFVQTAIASIFFGLAMATFWRSQAQSLKLPPWNDFPRPDFSSPRIPGS